ncbi:hypothetical protein ACOI1H_01720 [Loktanella sp. DJP18]|uniref:hypothetical protein n=1 Tax=Loktanella sp. DJP18 TaxID=3409788 RepID=UPI003BB497F7
MFTLRNLIIVAIAGIIGTIANAIAVNIVAGAEVMPLILSWGRHAVAVVVALLLIPIFARRADLGAWILALVALTVIPSLLAILVFGAAAPWTFVLSVNAVYAFFATLIFAVSFERS